MSAPRRTGPRGPACATRPGAQSAAGEERFGATDDRAIDDPYRIARIASPIATADDAQATEYVSVGPVTPNSSEICAAGALFIAVTTVVGLTRQLSSSKTPW